MDLMDERSLRTGLAACYRLVAHFGWDDLVFTHISARIPGEKDAFLINPYGMLFEEITAGLHAGDDVRVRATRTSRPQPGPPSEGAASPGASSLASPPSSSSEQSASPPAAQIDACPPLHPAWQ
jgi:Class II Aldolase and Adducin N-terminal domain